MVTSMYIHIPFCKTICKYCDFCKVYQNDTWVKAYIEALKKEIQREYRNDTLQTIYIGGGTPNCLSLEDFENVLQFIDAFKREEIYEYTIECNVELLTEQQILLMKKYGVNRVSLGVQTLQPKFMKFLNRHHTMKEVKDKIKLLKQYGIDNINVDMMYAFPLETLEDLKQDIIDFLQLDVPHISTYSLMIAPHTILYTEEVTPIEEEMDAKMYEMIREMMHGYIHYEVSNFAKKGYESNHNLVYWNNEEYYGFGLSSSGYVHKVRYTNTKNLFAYLETQVRSEAHTLSKKEEMENEMILGLRKMEGVSLTKFYSKYGKKVEEVFEIESLLKRKQLLIKGDYIKINDRYIYTSNNILINFIGSD